MSRSRSSSSSSLCGAVGNIPSSGARAWLPMEPAHVKIGGGSQVVCVISECLRDLASMCIWVGSGCKRRQYAEQHDPRAQQPEMVWGERST